MKVTFIDNADSQYKDSAARIKVQGAKGKLYLGDRDSASFLQLQYRECTSVVNCCVDTHGLAKDLKVKYCCVDPDEDSYIKEFQRSFVFIETELASNKNVLVHCTDGHIKSAAIVLYFVMKKMSIPLSECLRIVEKYRPGIKIKASLAKKLMVLEKALLGGNSIAHDGKKIVLVDTKLKTDDEKLPVVQSSAINSLMGVGAFFAVLFGILFAVTGKL